MPSFLLTLVRPRGLVFLAVAIGATGLPPARGAAPPVAGAPPSSTARFGGAYCGVYSVYAALRTLGIPVRFDDLLEHRYVGSYNGSTLAELLDAVVEHGGHAAPVEGLTAASLRASRYPIILHVRRPGLKTPYGHWILFLGQEGGMARIVDPPYPVQTIPYPDLLSLWDGVGLIVSAEPPTTWPLRAAAWFEFCVVFLMSAATLGCLRLARTRPAAPQARVRLSYLAVPAAAVLTAACSHLLLDTGFFNNRTAVAQVLGRHFLPDLQTIAAAELIPMLGQPGVAIVDARLPGDYARGHLPGAVNLPVYSGLADRSETLSAIRREDLVVVYCQSESCPWGKIIASDLVLRGYTNVHLLSGGWNEWTQHTQRDARP